MLGICDGIEFRDSERTGKVKYNSNIERFQSPILFKIINNELFIIPKKFLRKCFIINLNLVMNSKAEENLK
ncbi:hypothetical protein JTS99_12540 [Clostridium botulinum]|nr:hypothetical protein [Clostridium botulinum]MCS4516091.1 hypothetical protein [Clostridium botulinum]